jgi:hypothetical protein
MKAVRDESLSAATGRLQAGSERVVQVLLQVAEDKNAPASARVAAANHFLTYAYKAAELEDITQQIEEIKQALQ